MKQATLFFLCLMPGILFAQTDSIKRKSIFLEIAGSGGFGSVNFEKHFYKKKNIAFTWRAGLGFAPITKDNGIGIVFPLMINSIIGKSSHKLEFGLGQGITITTKGSFFALTTASIGYRYQRETKNWFYRVAYTPLISYILDIQIQHWAGVSIGYTLNNTLK